MSLKPTFALCLFAALLLAVSPGRAQELNPRAYWPTPAGTKAVVFGYQWSSGDVVTDPALPIEGADSTVEFATPTYQQTFGLFGRTTTLQLNVPYAWGKAEGLVEGEFRQRSISSLADVRARIAINLVGAPTLSVADMQALRAKPRTIFGASLLVQAPTGGYDADRLFNAGSNRWGVKPAIGLIWPMRPRWLLEMEVGAWFFTDNDDFLGAVRKQDPIVSAEMHLIRRIRPGFWAAVDLNYYAGGRTETDGVPSGIRQENSRIGATVLFPFKRKHAIRASFSTSLKVTAGGDFDTFTLAYIYGWR